MNKAKMLCLGPKKSLLSLGLELMANGAVYQWSEPSVKPLRAIQMPQRPLYILGQTFNASSPISDAFISIE